MTDITAVNIKVNADSSAVSRASDALGRFVDKTGRVRDANGKFSSSNRRASDSLLQIEQSGNRASTALQGIFTLISGAGIFAMIKMIDAYNNTNALLKIVTSSTSEFVETQKELFDISQDNYQQIGAVTKQYAGQAKQLEDMGRTHAEAIEVVDLFGKSLATSGATATESASATLQWTQAISSGVLRGEEFNSIMENGRGVAIALADGLNVNIGTLRKMANDGKLSAETVVNALLSQGAAIRERFAQIPLTVDKAWTLLTNSVTVKLAEIDKKFGVTSGIAKFIKGISENIDDANSKFDITNATIAALGAAAVPILFLITNGILAATAAATAFAFTPIGAIVVALTAAVGAVLYLRDELFSFGENTATVMDWVVSSFEYFYDFISTTASSLFDSAIAHYDEYSSAITESETWDTLKGYMLQVPGIAKQVANSIVAYYVASYKSVRDGYALLPAALKDISIQALNGMISSFETGVNTIILAIHNIPINAINAFNDLVIKGGEIFDRFVAGLETLPASFANIFARAMAKAKDAVFSGVNWVIDKFNKIGADIDPLKNVDTKVTKSISSIVESIKTGEKVTADDIFQINLGRIENDVPGAAKKLKGVITSNFKEAFDTDYVGSFGDAITSTFDKIGKAASDRRAAREYKALGEAMNSANEKAKPVAKTLANITGVSKEAKKAADDLKASKQALADGYSGELIALEKERLQIAGNELALYRYGLEQERFGKNNLKYSESQLNVLEAEKKRNLSLKDAADKAKEKANAEADALKASNAAIASAELSRLSVGKTDQQVRELVLTHTKGYTPALAATQAANEALKKSEDDKRSAMASAKEAVKESGLALDIAKQSVGKTDQQVRELVLTHTKGYTPAMAATQAANEALKKSEDDKRSAMASAKEAVVASTLALDIAKQSVGKTDQQVRELVLTHTKGYTPAMAATQAANEALKKSEDDKRSAMASAKEAVKDSGLALDIAKQSVGKTDQQVRELVLTHTEGYTPAMAATQAANEALTSSENRKREELIKVNEAYDETIKKLNDEAFALTHSSEETRRRTLEQQKYSATQVDAILYQEKANAVTKEANEINASFSSIIMDDMKSSLQSLVDTGTPLLDKLINKLIDLVFQAIEASLAMESIGTSGTAGGGGGVGSYVAQGINYLVGAFHTGGLPSVEAGSGSKTLATLPKFHTGGMPGLKSNEMPIVVENDEGIFTSGQMAAMAPVAPLIDAVNNQPQQQSAQTQVVVKNDVKVELIEDASKAGQVNREQIGETEVIQIVASNIYNAGEIDNAITETRGTPRLGTV